MATTSDATVTQVTFNWYKPGDYALATDTENAPPTYTGLDNTPGDGFRSTQIVTVAGDGYAKAVFNPVTPTTPPTVSRITSCAYPSHP